MFARVAILFARKAINLTIMRISDSIGRGISRLSVYTRLNRLVALDLSSSCGLALVTRV